MANKIPINPRARTKRIQAILSKLSSLSKGNYESYLPVSDDLDEWDAIAAGVNSLGESLKAKEKASNEQEARINKLIEVLLKYTIMDFSMRCEISDRRDELDAMAAGLNTLGEELDYAISQLKQSEDKLSKIIEHAPDAVVVINQEGNIKTWNPAAEKIFGWRETEAIDKPLHDLLIPSRYHKQHQDGLKRFIESGVSRILDKTIEMPATRKDGTEIVSELTISHVKQGDGYLFIAFLRDISERKKAEDEIRQLNNTLERKVEERTLELQESERKYKMLFESSPLPKWIIDMEEYRFQAVNEAAIKHYGYSREEFLSMTAVDIRPESEREKFLNFNRTFPDKAQNIGTWKHQKKDGTVIDVELTVQYILYNGKSCRLVVVNDVTEKLKAYQELNLLNEKLEQLVEQRTSQLLNANRELEAFTYSVSHDLRAPLRAINGYAQMLSEDWNTILPPEGLRQLNSITENATRMGQLIDDLLRYSRLGKTELNHSSFNLNEIVEEVINELKQAVEIRAKIKIQELGNVVADHILIRQVYMNLLENALKFSSKKSEPQVEIGVSDTLINGNRVYYVKDNGAGFDMRYYENMFGVFQRLHSHEEFEGTGVGLAIVKRIITLHEGQVWAIGVLNEGATFFFTLKPNQSL
jgi:PAS domain S-box-containing protein